MIFVFGICYPQVVAYKLIQEISVLLNSKCFNVYLSNEFLCRVAEMRVIWGVLGVVVDAGLSVLFLTLNRF